MKINRFVIVLLAITLFIFPSPVHASTLDSASFWAQAGIAEALKKGFVPTRIQSKYTANITRREFANLALQYYEYVTGKTYTDVLYENGYEVMGISPGKPAYSVFDDIMGDSQVVAAYALGIIGGTTSPTADKPGKFSPDALLTREQAAVMVRNLLKALGADITNTASAGFTDIGQASGWAVDSINYIRNAGVMGGTSTVPLMFSPKNNYTREQSILTFNNIKVEKLTPQAKPTVTTEAVIGGINLGFTREQVYAVMGEPQRTIPSTFIDGSSAGEWLIYHKEDYKEFYMVGINNDGLVPHIYTTALDGVDLDGLNRSGSMLMRYSDPNKGNPFVWLISYTSTSFGNSLYTEGNVQCIFEFTNAFRGVHSKNPLVWNDLLAKVAQTHSEDMNANKFLSHTGSDGSAPQDRARKVGYKGLVSENAAEGSTGLNTVSSWIHSPVHRITLLIYSVDVGIGVSGNKTTLNLGDPNANWRD